jgi:hypothetical protein
VDVCRQKRCGRCGCWVSLFSWDYESNVCLDCVNAAIERYVDNNSIYW